jgi:hypothetical protein
MGPWTQLWVRGDNVTRESMARVDDHIQGFGGLVHTPPHGDGLPAADPDGTYEVRVLFGDPGFVKFVLQQHYGLTIAREQINAE